MTFSTTRQQLGKEPITIAVIQADTCSRDYDSSAGNLFVRSEELDSSSWIKNSYTITANNAFAPDGEKSADKVNVESSGDVRTPNRNHGVTPSVSTHSIFLKPGTIKKIRISDVYDSTTNVDIDFTDITNITTTTGAGVDAHGFEQSSNGFYRFYITFAPAGTSTRLKIQDNEGIVGNFYAWGAQTEVFDEMHHYVKTESSTANGSCNAELGVTGAEKCYRTRNTCQDPDNFTKILKEFTLPQSRSNLPIGVSMTPCLEGTASRAPSSITGGKGLGNRHTVSLTFNDFPHHDRGVDPYWDERATGGEESGTFWGKWLARHKYYEGRNLVIKTGYISDPWDWDNFESEHYDIDRIDGPTNGRVTLKATDILTRTYARKARYPAASEGELLADITDVATSATLTPTGIGNTDYPASGYVSIGKEIASFTRSGDVLTLTRAQWGSEAASASAGDTVQLCVSYSDENVVDALYDVLTNGTDISDAYIPYDDGATGTPENWDDEKSLWLSTSNVTGIITEPTPVEDIISEWSDHFMFDIWWDLVDQEINIKALSPEPSGVTIPELGENYNILRDSVKITKNPKDRITTVIVRYDKINHAEKNDQENFARTLIFTDPSAEGADKYNESSIKEIKSKWFDAEAYALQYSGRQVARFLDTPVNIEFEVDAKDDTNISLADRIKITTKHIQDVTGASLATNFQISEVRPLSDGDKIRCRGIISSFTGRYGFVAPDGTPDYLSASEDQTLAYGFIGEAGGADFSDGTTPYKVI